MINPERVWSLLWECRKETLDAAEEPELAGEFDLHIVRNSPAWLMAHPSGFHAEGFAFNVSPERIATTVETLNAEQSDEYVQCINDWLWSSTLDHAETIWTDGAMVLSFTTKHPAQAVCIANIAQRHGHTLAEWLFGT